METSYGKTPMNGSASLWRPRLLLVEDEPVQQQHLNSLFATAGYMVATAGSVAEAHTALGQIVPDLVVLDLGLPDGSGHDLVPEIRRRRGTGLIILTAREGEADRVLGLELGADDYLAKPFNPKELLLRTRNLLRRLSEPNGPEKTDLNRADAYLFDGWRFDPGERRLEGPDRQVIPLTASETRLLHVLVEHAGTTVARQDLLAASGHGPETGSRSVDWLILRLRRKLLDDARNPEIIVGVRGVGYRFAAEVEPAP